MKKPLFWLLSLVLCLSMCACGENGETPNETPSDSNMSEAFLLPSDGYDGSKVTITFYHSMGQALCEVLDKYIAEFNKLYPNITIEHWQVGDYGAIYDQVMTELAEGDHPNIVYCQPDNVIRYNLESAVVALDNLIASDIEISRADGTSETLGLTKAQQADFIDAFYNEGKQFGDGRMYAMPLGKTAEVLYYNKTFFAEHHLDVPTTWEEMEAVCERIKQIDPNAIPLGYDSEANLFITMCEQLGSDYTSTNKPHFLFNNETNKNFVKRFREWYEKNYLTTTQVYGNYLYSLFNNAPREGEPDDPNRISIYMVVSYPSSAKHMRGKDEVGISVIPQVNPDDPKILASGPSLCIFKDENPQEVIASWLFVKFLTTNADFQADFALATGYIPALQSVAEHSDYKAKIESADGFDNIGYLAKKVVMEQADAYYTPPAFDGAAKARSEVANLLYNALAGNAYKGVDALIDKLFETAIQNCQNE